MLTLLSECHFWTFREEVRIKHKNFGVFRYMRQRELQQQATDINAVSKRDYTEKRNSIAVFKRKGAQRRLKDNLKKLEELLKQHKIAHSQWRDATQLLLLFTNGIIVHICVDIYTGDILRMVYEKYFVGKLAAETITDAFFTRTHIVLAYNTNQLTVVHLQKANRKTQGPVKISSLDPRIFHVIIPGPADRKLARHLAGDQADTLIVWTKSSQNEVYPWRPTIREADRANIHIFKLKDSQLESKSYCWSEHDPLSVDFLRSSEKQIIIVEEKISRKGDISAEICSYEITSGRMQRNAIASIQTETQICCFAFSPDQEKLFIGTIDRKICLYDLVQQTSKFLTQIDIIPNHCTWHSDSSIIMIANDRSQFQCFDLALTPIGNQLQSEDVTPSNLLDLSHYFTLQPTLLNIAYSPKPDLGNFTQNYAQTDCFLLLLYENGPLGVLRFFAGGGMRGDIHNSGLTADVIVDKYLALNQLEKALHLLQALNWETYGAMCLISLHKIANYVFYRSELRQSRIEILAKALKTFTEDLSEETKDDFSDQVFDLKRRFFFYLLRKKLYVEAFEVALDIDDYDLFMDVYNVTKANIDFIEFSATAFSQAAAILHEEERANGTHVSLIGDYRSESACSHFSTSTDTVITLQRNYAKPNKNSLKSYVPPLPSFKSKVFNAEMIRINIPKPELRLFSNDVVVERNNPLQQNFFSISNEQNYGEKIPSSLATTLKTSSSIVSTLAALSPKNENGKTETSLGNSKSLNNNGVETNQLSPISTTQHNQLTSLPDQTIGIPTVQNIPTYNMLPRALNQITNNIFQTNSRNLLPPTKPSTPFAHYAPLVQNYNNTMPSSYAHQPKFYQHPLVLGTIPPTSISALSEQQKRATLLAKKPPASILSNATSPTNQLASMCGNTDTTLSTNKDSSTSNNAISKNTNGGEKNKVKFSDTVQVAVVPDIQRKDKPTLPKRNGYSRQIQRNQLMNPKKELADSLPLCHPNDDYLKDFNPLQTVSPPRHPNSKTANSKDRRTSSKSTPASTPSIKVVHFGIV